MKKISIFGSTGSIGKSTLSVIKNARHEFEILALVARSDVKNLIAQCLEFQPSYAVIENENHLEELKYGLRNLTKCQVLAGKNAVDEIAKIKCDLLVAAIVGFAGVVSTLNAIRSGSNIALANKESLVCAGKILTAEAQKNGVKILPIDSEHNAIFQIFENDNLENIEEIILTASGGPFFGKDIDFSKITVEQALKHPNWNMGAKISIDSATMMNKGLEMIEALHFFPIKKQQIAVLVHPQSIIHGIVNYNDGSSLAALSYPDMCVPISAALSYPKRMKIQHQKLNLAQIKKLEFFEIDDKKFPALKLAWQAMEDDGAAPIVLNAANEIAVEKFLNRQISFDKIVEIVAKTLDKIANKNLTTIEEIIEFDALARSVADKN